jgi:deoxyribodipyrimidine photolyase-related protein
MIINNILTMMEVNIRDVYRWFMTVSVDSYDWVMLPNICMNHNAMRADHQYMSRTYISGSNYLRQMSDYSKNETEIFDTLFDSFVSKYADTLIKDYQLAGIAKRKIAASNRRV